MARLGLLEPAVEGCELRARLALGQHRVQRGGVDLVLKVVAITRCGVVHRHHEYREQVEHAAKPGPWAAPT
jgi:hypothetical protein